MKKFFLSLPLSVLLMISLPSCKFFSEEEKNSSKEELSPGVDGVQKKYRDNKTLLSTTEHKNAQRHGISRSYYEDGKTVHNEIRYNMGVKDGTTNSYYKNGQLYYSVEYVNGKREGILTKYYESGERMAEIPYEDNRVQEGLIEYQKSGKKKAVYPHIVFEEIDRMVLDSKYIIKIRLSDANKSVKFTQILYDESGNELAEKELLDYDGIAEIIIFVREHTSVHKTIKIRAEFNTFLGNPFVCYEEKSLSIQR